MGQHAVKSITKEKTASSVCHLGYLPLLFPGSSTRKKHPGHQTQVLFNQSIHPTGVPSYRWMTRYTQGGSGSKGPLLGLGITIGGRMEEPGPGKKLTNTNRIGSPHFLHRCTFRLI